MIVINKIDYDAQNPSFKLHCPNGPDDRNGPLLSSTPVDACTIQWAREDLTNLRIGDKYANDFPIYFPEI